ncbi:MAG: MFS transporter [Methylococcus sp.]|nr:MFS transporter [Methylococcus sp.]
MAPSDTQSLKNVTLLACLNRIIVGLVGVAAPLFAMSLNASTFEIGMAIDRIGAKRVFAVGSALGAIAFFLVSRSTSPGGLILATAIASPAVPMHFLSIQSDFFHHLRVAGNRKAGWMRAMQMGGSIAVGPLLASVLIHYLDYPAIYVLVAASFALMLLLARKVLTGRADALARRAAHHDRPIGEQLKTLFGHREIAETSLISFASSGAATFYSAFILVIAIEQFRISEEAAAPLISGQGLSYIGAVLPGRCARNLGTAYLLPGRLRRIGSRAAARVRRRITRPLAGRRRPRPELGMVAVANVVRHAAVSSQLGRGNVAGAGNPPAAIGSWAGAFIGGVLGGWIGLQNVFLVFIGSFAVLSWFEPPRAIGSLLRDYLAQLLEIPAPACRRLTAAAFDTVENWPRKPLKRSSPHTRIPHENPHAPTQPVLALAGRSCGGTG